jgi:ABC-type multidrug transport system ATPase subunit
MVFSPNPYGIEKCMRGCAQEDSFVPTLSVWETLGINARLRLPLSIKTTQRRTIMTDILESMGLAKVKHSQVTSAP